MRLLLRVLGTLLIACALILLIIDGTRSLAASGIVLVHEPGRALTARDVERSLGAPVVAELHYDPAVARAVDAGLLAARLPRSLAHSLKSAA